MHTGHPWLILRGGLLRLIWRTQICVVRDVGHGVGLGVCVCRRCCSRGLGVGPGGSRKAWGQMCLRDQGDSRQPRHTRSALGVFDGLPGPSSPPIRGQGHPCSPALHPKSA